MKNTQTIESYISTLPEEKQYILQKQIKDFADTTSQVFEYPLEPFDHIDPQTEDEEVIGKTALSNNPLSIILLAGGVGSRLNFEKPKGLFPLSVLRKKSLFQLFFEHCKAAIDRYGMIQSIGLLINGAFKKPIETFLQSNAYFGVSSEQIDYLIQKETPYLYDESWFLEDEYRIAAAPNGNGGLFDAYGFNAYSSTLTKKGIQNCLILPIDNPFLFQVNASHYGRHLFSKADITCGGIEREIEKNPMGLFAKSSHGPVIIDYPLLEQNAKKDTFLYGNINAFFVTTSFLQKIIHTPLPTHYVTKKTYRFDPISNEKTEILAIKGEKFITDLPLLASMSSCHLYDRKSVYAPLKTESDVEDIQKKLLARDQAFLIDHAVPYAGDIELHPRYYYMGKEEFMTAIHNAQTIEGYLP